MTKQVIQRIKEYQGYDEQTKSNITYWKVFYLDENNETQTKIVHENWKSSDWIDFVQTLGFVK